MVNIYRDARLNVSRWYIIGSMVSVVIQLSASNKSSFSDSPHCMTQKHFPMLVMLLSGQNIDFSHGLENFPLQLALQ